MNRWLLTALGFILLLATALAGLYAGDTALRHGTAVTVPVPGEALALAATYFPGAQPAGILLLEGFGSDQTAVRSLASEFAQAGVHVFTVDFSGHGRSPGAITFDNAATDVLARQVLAARRTFAELSGLPEAQILLLGHSMGARVALQALTLDPSPAAGLILLGAQVNLTPNQQAQVFTGVSDADLPWVQQLGPDNPPADILLLTGAWDDILPPSAAELLLAQLTDGAPSTWARDLIVLDNLVHNYEIYSPRALALAKTWAAARWQIPLPDAAPTAQRRIVFWVVGLTGLLGAVFAGWRWVETRPDTAVSPAWSLTIHNMRTFLLGKLLLWLAAIPFALLLGGIFFLLPLDLPAFNLYYVVFLGGYGLLMALLYLRGRMPGVTGRLALGNWRPRAADFRALVTDGRFWLAVGIGGLLLAGTAVFAHTGLFTFVTGARLVWALLFTPVTALGFAIGLREIQMVSRAAPGKWWPLAATAVIGLIPFFLYTLFLGFLGSISGVLAGLQGLIILALVLLAGGLLQRIGGRLWVTAVLQAFLLYWLVLPVGPLFATG